MHTITMPQAGQSMEEGTIVRWRKAVGDAVRPGEVLLEIETDKSTIEVESTQGGVLRQVLVPAGATVPVHTPLALIGAAEEALPSPQAADAPSTAPPAAPSPALSPPAGPPAGAVVPVLMPQAGQSVEEAVLLRWMVKPGDIIAKGQPIFEIETDKSNIEVEAADAGRLARIVVAEGAMVPVLTPVAYLADNDADVDAYLAAAGAQEAPAPAAAAAPTAAPRPAVAAPAAQTESGRVKASPAARKAAAERGIDLASVGRGSGPGGRILSTDIPAAPTAKPAPTAPSTPGGRRKMSGMRRAIARNLLASKQTIPHFYMRLTIDADPLFAFYKSEKAKYPCSVNDVVTMACARAVAEFPMFRSRIEGDEIVELPGANIGIAVGMDDGLVVPVLRNAETLSLQGIAAETRRLVEAARKGKIEGMGEGAMTITNLGMFGVEEFAAIINPPEAAILAVGAIREAVIVRDGALRAGRKMTMTLSADHRIIDGLWAARFLARLKELLESPSPAA